MRGETVLRLLIAAALGAGAMFLLYDPITRFLHDWAFSDDLLVGAGPVYGFGMAFPYVTMGAPITFLILFPLLAWGFFRKTAPRLAVEIVAGAAAWSAPTLWLFVSGLLWPPFEDPAISARAMWRFTFCFLIFQTAIGAFAGLVAWVSRKVFA